MSCLGSADFDASRRPKFAELLRFAPRRSCATGWSGASSARVGTTSSAFPSPPSVMERPTSNDFATTARRCLALMPAEQGVVDLAGRRTLLRRPCGRANVAVARRLDRPSAAGPRSGGGRPAGRAARGTVAHHRAGGANHRDRSLAPGRLGARRQHALRTGLALFEVATARSASSRGFLADLLGRGALRAAGRQAVHDPRRADDRADRRGAWTSLRRRPHRRGDQAGLSSGRRPGGRPGATARRSIPSSRRALIGNAAFE